MTESMQERCEREVRKAKSVNLVVFNVDISVVKGRIASDAAVGGLRDDLLDVLDVWVAALPLKGAR